MNIGRREFLLGAVAAAVAGPRVFARTKGEAGMYGLIGKMIAVPGRRDELMKILIEGTSGMPGCLSYIVAADASEPDAIWVTEVWESEASHEASLSLPSVREAIARGRPLIAGFGERFVTAPVGGQGLPAVAEA